MKNPKEMGLDEYYRPVDIPAKGSATGNIKFDAQNQDYAITARKIASFTYTAGMGGTLGLGGTINTFGVLQALDNSGSVVVQIDNSGITATAGTLDGVNVGKIRITNGTLNNAVLGTPAITGGTANNITIGTPAIIGGTMNNGVFGTPATSGGTLTNPSIVSGTVSDKLFVTTGSNKSIGKGTLTAGSVTISTTAVTANSLFFLTDLSAGLANIGFLAVGLVNAGTSFNVHSSSVLDVGTFSWWFVN